LLAHFVFTIRTFLRYSYIVLGNLNILREVNTLSAENENFQLIFKSITELKSEVNSLRAELGGLEGSVLRERVKSVEEALSQNRLLLFANQLQEELVEDAQKLVRTDCKNQRRECCVEKFNAMKAENLKLLKSLKPKEAIEDFDSKIDTLGHMMEKAKDTQCEPCIENFQKRLKKEKRALQTVIIVENPKSDTQNNEPFDIAFKVKMLLEPLANLARLTILVNLFEGKKSFSKLAQITGLKGGHLIFHLKKLVDAQLIAQEDKKGDYIITQSGVEAIKKIS